jgi:hypothetical protein
MYDSGKKLACWPSETMKFSNVDQMRLTNKNHSYKHNEQINKQNIDNSECLGVKFVKIYPEITSQ